MEDFPQTLTTVRATPALKHTVEVSRPQVARPKPVATKTVVADQRRQAPNVPHPVQRTSRKSAMWSRPKKSIEPTGGGTRSDNHCSRRGNSAVEEGFNWEKAPYPSSTKDDRGSSRCDQDPLRIEGCAKKGPFQDHGCSPPVGYGNIVTVIDTFFVIVVAIVTVVVVLIVNVTVSVIVIVSFTVS